MTTLEITPNKIKNEIIQDGINKIADRVEEDCNASDLHYHLYNEDYFIIGYAKAEEFLDGFVFNAIEAIKNYEQDNFGEVNTDFSSSEKVANMLAYIVGEEALQECPTFQDKWNEDLSEDDLKLIAKELESQLVTES